MVDKPVQKMPVVRNDYQRASELFQVFFQNIECHYVQIIGRLVQYQQVGLFHQDGQQIKTPLFSSAEGAYLVVQHVMREQEPVQQPGVVHGLQHSVFRIEGNPALMVVAYFQ